MKHTKGARSSTQPLENTVFFKIASTLGKFASNQDVTNEMIGVLGHDSAL